MAKIQKKVARKARRKKTAAPTWERGYRSWGFWEGKTKLGWIQLGEHGKWDGKYRWQVATVAGETATLSLAKRAVEEFAAYDKRQLSLGF
jgi:hypothetical protein